MNGDAAQRKANHRCQVFLYEGPGLQIGEGAMASEAMATYGAVPDVERRRVKSFGQFPTPREPKLSTVSET